MTQEEELTQVRAERNAWRDIAYEKHQEVLHLQQEKQMIRDTLKEAMQAIEQLQGQAKTLEGQIEVLQERVKMLEGQLAKDSHNSSLPPSSDRFVRSPKSLRKTSKKKPGGQQGHRGHHLRQVGTPDEVLVYTVEQCEWCQHDLRDRPAALPERRQVIDLEVETALGNRAPRRRKTVSGLLSPDTSDFSRNGQCACPIWNRHSGASGLLG